MAGVLKIITVDDSPVVVNRLQCILSEISGVEFAGSATSIPEALVIIKRKLPDVVFLDIHLNSQDGRNGTDLLVTLRKIYPSLKIIMLTNLTSERYRTLCLEGGADHFLDKSEEFEKIPDIINQILTLRQQ